MTVLVLPGDGIGTEVTREAVRVLERVASRFSHTVKLSEGLLGGNFVEIVPGGSLDNLPPGGEIIDTQGAVSLLNLLLTYVGGDAAPAE